MLSASIFFFFFFFNDTATTEIYTLSLHDALPILIGDAGVVVPGDDPLALSAALRRLAAADQRRPLAQAGRARAMRLFSDDAVAERRSEEHTSELQSRSDLVCRLLLEKKKKHHSTLVPATTHSISSAGICYSPACTPELSRHPHVRPATTHRPARHPPTTRTL